MKFADYLDKRVTETGSVLCAGIDPRIPNLPKAFLEKADKESSTNEDFAYVALTSFYSLFIETAAQYIACAKPNIAFFEQYGIGGIKAFVDLCALLKENKIPIIADVKRGDIGSTAIAYSNAFLGKTELQGKSLSLIDADAITVSPFLGFDTIEVFLKIAEEYDKGIFVLVKTSNPGSGDIQDLSCDGATVSKRIAGWLSENAPRLIGECGYSGVGAVVGATYPEEAKQLRALMPTNLFLIPGFGAQGGTSEEALVTFDANKRGGIVSASRGLIKPVLESSDSIEQIKLILTDHLEQVSGEL